MWPFKKASKIDPQVFLDAIDLLGQDGEHWRKGAPHFEGKYCLGGAIAAIVTGSAEDMNRTRSSVRVGKKLLPYYTVIADVVADLKNVSYAPYPDILVEVYNDNYRTSYTDVKEALVKSAEAVRRGEYSS